MRSLRDFFARRRPQQPVDAVDSDHRPAPIDDTCLQLEDAYRRPTAKRRNTRGTQP